MGLGCLQQQTFQLLQLGVGETGLGSGVGLGGESSEGLLGELDPGVDGGPPAPQESGDVVRGFALLDELDSPEAAALEFFSGPDGSDAPVTSGAGGRFSWRGWSQ